MQGQSNSLENGPENTSGTSNPFAIVPLIVSESDQSIVPTNQVVNNDNISIDLDLPIAQRKGKRSCTNHPLSKNLPYGKLSQKHFSFVSKRKNNFEVFEVYHN